MSAARQNSVRHLAELYTIVIALALTVAIEGVINKSNLLHPSVANWSSFENHIINVLTFLVIIVPFYHGAVRHLFATYIEGDFAKTIKNGALLVDFFLLFVEGCLFIVMAWALPNSNLFAWVVVLLLILDSVWGFLAWLAFAGVKAPYAERTWARINIVTAAFLALLLIFAKNVFEDAPLLSQVGILVIISLRTILDYTLCWDFYFPEYAATARTSTRDKPKNLPHRSRRSATMRTGQQRKQSSKNPPE